MSRHPPDPRAAQDGAAKVIATCFFVAAGIALFWSGLPACLALAAGGWLFLQARPGGGSS